MSELTTEQIENEFKDVQNYICNFLVENSGENYKEDKWDYDKGTGGGITRVWESPILEEGSTDIVLEKGGVNYSGISGDALPAAALEAHKLEGVHGFKACGVSLVIHPMNPFFPTIHMNIRYFEIVGTEVWWFGGGVDLTPNYVVNRNDIVEFHRTLQRLCAEHQQSYETMKHSCDEYFFLPHRNENRGIGGIFFDQLGNLPSNHNNNSSSSSDNSSNSDNNNNSKEKIFKFVVALGRCFVELYRPFFQYKSHLFSKSEREFQLIRRSRYAEFNLIWDRGTKFGIQSRGRTESILMSMPAVAYWRYDWHPSPGSVESDFMMFYLHPQNWVDIPLI